jgi:hypothetical protein
MLLTESWLLVFGFWSLVFEFSFPQTHRPKPKTQRPIYLLVGPLWLAGRGAAVIGFPKTSSLK